MSCIQRELAANAPTQASGATNQDQLLRYAEDVATLQRLRHLYEHLLPDTLDPHSTELPPPIVRQATAMFSDIRGFTHIAEKLIGQPTKLLEIVNEHMSVAVQAVLHCGGTIEKFVGDGVFATFGARRDMSDHAECALAAGMAIVTANEALNRRRADARGFRMDVGIGLATGELVLGVIGSDQRAELGVLGDAVNVASRLVTAAYPSDILLNQEAYQAAKNNIRPETVGRISVRGRTGPIGVYRISFNSALQANDDLRR
jgi:adenylate cyclase